MLLTQKAFSLVLLVVLYICQGMHIFKGIFIFYPSDYENIIFKM